MRHETEQGTKTVCFYAAAARAVGQNRKQGLYDSWQAVIRMSDKKRSQHTLPAPKYQVGVTLLDRLWGHQPYRTHIPGPGVQSKGEWGL